MGRQTHLRGALLLTLGLALGACAAGSGGAHGGAPDAAGGGAMEASRHDASAGDAGPAPDGSPGPALDAAPGDAQRAIDSGPEDGAPADAAPRPPGVTTELVTDEHRYVPGAMFGGWGPHLGHLVRAAPAGAAETQLYWVDDVCRQDSAGDCDVNVNRRVGVFRRDPDGWSRVGTVPLGSGVQQNTGTLASGGLLTTYGIDVLSHVPLECTFDLAAERSLGCTALPFSTGTDANYVGAALSPGGDRIVWWTNVVDGGGGSFSYVASYGRGWNGPRAGPVGGYNDCAYVNVAFRSDAPDFTFFGQVVSGTAPAWSYGTLVGETRLTSLVAPSWANALAAPPGDPVVSTDDLWIDPATQDTHLVARTQTGSAAYYFRPRGGRFGAPLFLEPATFRARWLVTPEVVALAYGPNAGGLRLRAIERGGVVAGTPLALDSSPPVELPMPADLGPVVAIYPAAAVYQSVEVPRLELVVVGHAHENEAVFVEVR